MLNLAVALAMTTLSVTAAANEPPIFVATNAEKASGFNSLAECERAIGGADKPGKAPAGHQRTPRGSVFNLKAGNTTRCEIVQGEPMVVVYPKGHEALLPPR